MSWWVAGSTFAAGTYGAVQKRKGAHSMAKERRRAARESLLTSSYNIRERNKESRQTQFQVLETGGRKTREIALAGLQAEGAATVSAGTSGAIVESGSPRAVLTSIVQEALQAQTEVVLDTRNHIKAVARDTTNKNTSEWRNAKLNETQQNRIASREKEAADREFTADMISTTASAYAGGAGVAGTGNIAKWGSAAKATTTGTKAITATTTASSLASQPGPHKKVASYSPISKGTGRMPGSTIYKSKPIKPIKGDWGKYGKIRPTGGRESSRTAERAWAQMKNKKLDFSKEGFNRIFDFSKGRVNSSWWNFFSGKGYKGRAKPGRMKGASQ